MSHFNNKSLTCNIIWCGRGKGDDGFINLSGRLCNWWPMLGQLNRIDPLPYVGWGSHHELKDAVIPGPPFCSPASPLLDGLLLSPPSSSSSSWAFDQSWPLCHSSPSGGSSPSPTTTLPAGLPSLMHTHGCKHIGAKAGPQTQNHTQIKQPKNYYKATTRRILQTQIIFAWTSEKEQQACVRTNERCAYVSLCLCVLRFTRVHKFTQVHVFLPS